MRQLTGCVAFTPSQQSAARLRNVPQTGAYKIWGYSVRKEKTPICSRSPAIIQTAGRTIGMYCTAEFNSWSNMVARCYRKTHHAYIDYGRKGVRVCKKWREPDGHGFLNFIRDMGPRPQYKTLDRINPRGHYEPTNCRWATWKVQGNNQTRYIWRNCAPPPIEKVREMEQRLEAEDLSYPF